MEQYKARMCLEEGLQAGNIPPGHAHERIVGGNDAGGQGLCGQKKPGLSRKKSDKTHHFGKKDPTEVLVPTYFDIDPEERQICNQKTLPVRGKERCPGSRRARGAQQADDCFHDNEQTTLGAHGVDDYGVRRANQSVDFTRNRSYDHLADNSGQGSSHKSV